MKHTSKTKNVKLRLRLIFLFFAIAYLPFMTALGLEFDAVGTSLSGIGWREGGLKFLLIYVLFTVPLMIYQVYLFITLSDKKNPVLMIIALVGGLMISIGAAFPVKTSSPVYSHKIHSYLCQIGSVLSIAAVTTMFVLYCRSNKGSIKKVAFLYAELASVIIVSFALFSIAALFEVGASFLILFAMFLLNLACYKNQQAAEKINPAEVYEAYEHETNYNSIDLIDISEEETEYAITIE